MRQMPHKSKEAGAMVPPIIHQTWKTHHIPSSVYHPEWVSSWRRHHPDWQYWFWTDADNRALVRDAYPWFLDTYDALPAGVVKADAARYLYMHQYGGVYADLDSECFADITPLLTNDIILGRLNTNLVEHSEIPNAFLASAPGHPFWIELITLIQERLTAGSATLIEELSGPILLTEVVARRRDEYPITIHPSPYIYPLDWREHSLADGTLPQTGRTFVHALHPEAYMANYWAHHWTNFTHPGDV